MKRFYNQLENYKLAILILVITVSLFFISNVLLIVGWHASQNHIRVDIPPQIPQSGLSVKAGEVPTATVYSFAYYIWQNLNHWSENGGKDYAANIKQFAPYLTPRFKAFLEQDANKRYRNDETQGRLRSMQGINGSAFSKIDVEALGHGTWIVHLTMRLTERVNTNGNVIKDTAIAYSLRVVRYDVGGTNLWGLALDGFSQDPQRIKTYI